MGERAIAVFAADTSSYHSQWGGSNETLAGVLDANLLSNQIESICSPQWQPQGTLSKTLPEAVDFLHIDAVYVLFPSDIRVYLPLWFGFPSLSRFQDPAIGALVRVDSIEAVRYTRSRFRRAKAALADGIEAGLFHKNRALWTLLHSLDGYTHPSRQLLCRAENL